jgi:hypothetical protein
LEHDDLELKVGVVTVAGGGDAAKHSTVTEQPTMGDDDLAEKTMLPMEFLPSRMATALLLLSGQVWPHPQESMIKE